VGCRAEEKNGDCERTGSCNECQDQGIDSASAGSRCSSQDKTSPRPAQGFLWYECKASDWGISGSVSVHDEPALALGVLPSQHQLVATTRIPQHQDMLVMIPATKE